MGLPFLVYFLITARSLLMRAGIVMLLPAAIATMVFCQVRVMILQASVGIAALIMVISLRASRETRKKIFFGVPAIVLALFIGLPSITTRWTDYQQDNVRAIERSLSLFDSNITSARSGTLDRIIAYATVAPLGAGLSRSGAAAEKFKEAAMRDPHFPSGFFADNFWAATIAEIGIPGSLILTVLIASVLLTAWQKMRMTLEPGGYVLQAAVFSSLLMLVVPMWGSEGLLYNPVAPFFWYFSGSLFRIQALDLEAVSKTPQHNKNATQLNHG